MYDDVNSRLQSFLRQGIDVTAAGNGNRAKALILPGYRIHAGNRIAHATVEERQVRGLLGGRQNRAEIVLPVTNSLHSSTRFFLDPEEMIAAILQLESRGMDVVGIYHSHPAGPAVPSETDLRETTWREAVILIWSPGREDWQLRAFRVDSGGWREVIMTVME